METDESSRYVVVNGRRWRASDTRLPDDLRQQLVDSLMRARRSVKSDGDTARPHVHDAKVALGERGAKWWEPTTFDERAQRIQSAARALLYLDDGPVALKLLEGIVVRRPTAVRHREVADAVRSLVQSDGGLRMTTIDGQPAIAAKDGSAG